MFFNVRGQSGTNWGPLSAAGTNSSISLVFADVAHAQVNARDGAVGLVQDTNYVGVSPLSNVASEMGVATPAIPEIRLPIQAQPVVWLWFMAESNTAYTVEFKNSLTEGEWQTLTNIGSGMRREVRLTNDAAASTPFYRATAN